MGSLRERGAAESGGGTQRAAGCESGRRGQAPAHGLRGAGCHRRGPRARARLRERRSPSSIPGGGASTGRVLLSVQWGKPKPSSPPPGPGLGLGNARRRRAPFQMQTLHERAYLPNNLWVSGLEMPLGQGRRPPWGKLIYIRGKFPCTNRLKAVCSSGLAAGHCSHLPPTRTRKLMKENVNLGLRFLCTTYSSGFVAELPGSVISLRAPSAPRPRCYLDPPYSAFSGKNRLWRAPQSNRAF